MCTYPAHESESRTRGTVDENNPARVKLQRTHAIPSTTSDLHSCPHSRSRLIDYMSAYSYAYSYCHTHIQVQHLITALGPLKFHPTRLRVHTDCLVKLV